MCSGGCGHWLPKHPGRPPIRRRYSRSRPPRCALLSLPRLRLSHHKALAHLQNPLTVAPRPKVSRSEASCAQHTGLVHLRLPKPCSSDLRVQSPDGPIALVPPHFPATGVATLRWHCPYPLFRRFPSQRSIEFGTSLRIRDTILGWSPQKKILGRFCISVNASRSAPQ